MTGNPSPARIGLIGFGAVGHEVILCLERRGEIARVVGVLEQPEQVAAASARAAGRFPVVGSIGELMAAQPDIVIEAAGHGAVLSFGAEILSQGCDLLVASTGALADQKFGRELADAARGTAEIWIAGGAVAGIDGLLAARTAGMNNASYTSLKERKAWNGTPAEQLLDDRADSERVIFFEGSAREAAILYPQNANVAATIALAGLGLDRTRVKLGADPHVAGPLGIIEADGDFGSFLFEILALASPTNPKTSALTGHSLVVAACDGMRFRARDLLKAS
ncbi:MAG: aspartate dehydrogenase [Pseudorhodoplanes sp.]|uniref:aspartate dehydrogenase n=1 Tax=Pseudorhodoplanes sp. TaxID=1934341 RepID=UPI003D0BF92C